MNWTDAIDRIYCISLPKSHERRKTFLKEMAKYDIPVSIWPGIYNKDGAFGLYETYRQIFQNSVDNDFDSILVFEDDAVILEPQINEIMNRIIDQLPDDWELIYLGCNPFGGFSCFVSENLLQLNSGAYTTHAVMYSKKGMEHILKWMDKTLSTIDGVIANLVQPDMNCYATFPLLCAQSEGYSYIQQRNVDYTSLIQERYEEKLKLIK